MRLLIAVLLILTTNSLQAQQCKLQIQIEVQDLHDGSLLSEALVEIYLDNRLIGSQLSNSQGLVNFYGLCEGNYTINISHVNCESITKKINLKNNKKEKAFLEHHIQELERVVVEGEIQEQVSTSQQSLTNADLIYYNSATLGEALKEFSGVDALSTGNNIMKPVIHGLFGSRIQILNNGVRQEGQEWGIEHAPNMDISAFNRLRVVKSGAALRHGGDAIGGLLIADVSNFSLADSLSGEIRLSGRTNGRGGATSFYLTHGLGNNWGVSVQGSYKRLGDLRAPDYILSNTGIERKGASINAGFRTYQKSLEFYYSYFGTDLGILRSAHVGTTVDLWRAIDNGQPAVIRDFTFEIGAPKQEVIHHLAKVSGHWRFPELGKFEWQYSFQFNDRKEFDVLRGDDFSRPALDLELLTHQLNIDWEWNKFDNWHFYAGLNGQYQENTPDPNTAFRRVIPDYEKYQMGAYASFDHNLSDNLIVEGGARLDYVNWDAFKFYRDDFWEGRGYDQEFPEFEFQDEGVQILTRPTFDFLNFSANAGLFWRISPSQNLKFNYALTERSPNAAELFADGLHQSAAIFEVGDLRLDAEVSNKFSLNWKNRIDFLEGFSVDLLGYYQSIDGFINQVPTGFEVSRGSIFPRWEYLQVDARMFGFNLDTSLDFPQNLNWSQRFAYVHGQDTENDIPLIHMPPTKWSNALRYTKNEWKNFYAEIQGVQVFRQSRYPNFDFDVSFIQDGEIITETVPISRPPEAYFLLNFKSGLAWNFNKGKKLTADLFAQNILNTNYREYLNRLRFYADDIGFNLSLILTYKF